MADRTSVNVSRDGGFRPGVSTVQADPFGGLSGADRDAYAAITNTLKAYGLESLAPTVLGYIKNGYSSETISVLLPDTPEYKQRFKANEQRKAAGLPVLSPSEYLSVEDSYRQVMSAAGLPSGFYDQPDDFTKWIAGDVSPTEVQQRVQTATDMVNSLDPAIKDQFRQWYTTGDMVAYALDRERSTTILDRQWRAAQAGGIAKEQGLNLSQSLAEQVAATGVDSSQLRQGLGDAAQIAKENTVLSGIYGGQYNDASAIAEVFLNDQGAASQRRGLASQERAQFGGSSATSAKSLTNRKAGQV